MRARTVLLALALLIVAAVVGVMVRFFLQRYLESDVYGPHEEPAEGPEQRTDHGAAD